MIKSIDSGQSMLFVCYHALVIRIQVGETCTEVDDSDSDAENFIGSCGDGMTDGRMDKQMDGLILLLHIGGSTWVKLR